MFSVDFFDQKKTFGDKLKCGAYLGFVGGASFALNDIAYHTHLTEAKARLLRNGYFIVVIKDVYSAQDLSVRTAVTHG